MSFVFHPQPCVSLMIPRQLDQVPWLVDRDNLRRLQGASCNDVRVERPTLVYEQHRPIQPLFDHDVGGVNFDVYLVELPVVRHRPITAQDPCHLET